MMTVAGLPSVEVMVCCAAARKSSASLSPASVRANRTGVAEHRMTNPDSLKAASPERAHR